MVQDRLVEMDAVTDEGGVDPDRSGGDCGRHIEWEYAGGKEKIVFLGERRGSVIMMGSMSIESLILIVVIVVLVFMCLLIFLTRYKNVLRTR